MNDMEQELDTLRSATFTEVEVCGKRYIVAIPKDANAEEIGRVLEEHAAHIRTFVNCG